MLPGLATSLAYFLGRDLYAAILPQNFPGIVGVIGSVDLALFRQPLYHIYALAVIAVLVLVGYHIVVARSVPWGFRER